MSGSKAQPSSSSPSASGSDAAGPGSGGSDLVQSASRPGRSARSLLSDTKTEISTDQLVAALTPGTLIDDKYEITSVIGIGGMGVVVAARHLDLGTDVALKFLSFVPGADGGTDLRARFRREARISAKLRNEHITRVLDVGWWRETSFIVMERLEGVDLRHKLKSAGGVFQVDVALNYALQVCEGIAEAHAANIVHRDLKPANLFLARRPDGGDLIKIMDFGISKWSGGEEIGEITKEGTLLGSPKYMSPEQIFGAHNIDPRADLWSIGAIFYEMASGRVPYSEPTLTLLCAALISGPPKPLSEVRPGFPPRLSEAIARCFVRDINKRYQSVAELAGALLDSVDAPGQTLRDRLAAVLSSPGSISETGSLRAPLVPLSGPTSTSAVSLPTASSITPLPGKALGDAAPTLVAGPQSANAPEASVAGTAPVAAVPKKGSKVALIAAAAAIVLVGGGALAIRSMGSSSGSPVSAAPQAMESTVALAQDARSTPTDPAAKPSEAVAPSVSLAPASSSANTVSSAAASAATDPSTPTATVPRKQPVATTVATAAPTTTPTTKPPKDPKGDDDIPTMR